MGRLILFLVLFFNAISIAPVSVSEEGESFDVDVDIHTRMSSISSIWTGKTIQIGGETFYFQDRSRYEYFNQRYGSTNCLASKTTTETCECQQILLQARLDAIEHGVQINDLDTPIAPDTSNANHRETKKHIRNF